MGLGLNNYSVGPAFHVGVPSVHHHPHTEKALSTVPPSLTDDASNRAASPHQVGSYKQSGNASVQKNLKVPKFTGTECVKGFFRKFETLTRQMGASEEEKKALLVSKLEGAADHWLLGQKEDWDTWSYETLKKKMVDYFGEESRTNARKLKACKQGNQGVAAYSDKFKEIAAAATGDLTELSIKDMFLDNLRSETLADKLRLVAD